jgi:hypothetical protein
MTKPVIMTSGQWDRVLEQIKKKEKPSVWLIREKMKSTLGFTVRVHKAWIENKNFNREWNDWNYRQQDSAKNDPWLDWEPAKGNTEYQVHLDFYDEQKRTMFLLKYGNGQN